MRCPRFSSQDIVLCCWLEQEQIGQIWRSSSWTEECRWMLDPGVSLHYQNYLWWHAVNWELGWEPLRMGFLGSSLVLLDSRVVWQCQKLSWSSCSGTTLGFFDKLVVGGKGWKNNDKEHGEKSVLLRWLSSIFLHRFAALAICVTHCKIFLTSLLFGGEDRIMKGLCWAPNSPSCPGVDT